MSAAESGDVLRETNDGQTFSVDGPARFRKKPIVISAMQVDGTYKRCDEILDWINGNGGDALRTYSSTAGYSVRVETLEGDMDANVDDWIIRGVVGEFYPCKADIFEATYEQVS